MSRAQMPQMQFGRPKRNSRSTRKKMASKSEAIGRRSNIGSRLETKAAIKRSLKFARAQRPKCGRSPLRLAISALFIRSRSIAASRRPNRELEGASAIAAVLDIDVPFCWRPATRRLIIWEQFMYTRYQRQCICLHGSILARAMQHKSTSWHPRWQKGRRTPPGALLIVQQW